MVIHSPLPSIDIPQVGLVQFLFSNINNVPEDRELLIDAETGKSLTFAAIKDNILRFAAGLQDKCQFKKGDVIAIFSPNQVIYIKNMNLFCITYSYSMIIRYLYWEQLLQVMNEMTMLFYILNFFQ